MDFLNKPYQNLALIAKGEKLTYASNTPFPNIHFTDFFNPEILESVLNEFPDLSRGKSYKIDNQGQVKLATKGTQRFGEAAKAFTQFLNSQLFLDFLQELTSIKEKLVPDFDFFGGGLHEIKRGGFLKLHADFNKHPATKMDRRLNALIYLNKGWKEEYGGHFELWDRDLKNPVKKIAPHFNTLAIFSTTDFSYHGHPDPLNCPESMSRKSIALYYYSDGRPAHEVNPDPESHSTLFVGRKGYGEDNITEKKEGSLKKMLKKLL